ncbi:hypothetical protein ECANGB1_379 [Enterospora canceri]|uniref:Uncharacterized protein n=1 Tax=Enterospora canceri TaxID=1081671 RepID=A0A1Y1S836_9MICR|nr:hypothetical protein ECANGB1_379 [Enterospora canceri]
MVLIGTNNSTTNILAEFMILINKWNLINIDQIGGYELVQFGYANVFVVLINLLHQHLLGARMSGLNISASFTHFS